MVPKCYNSLLENNLCDNYNQVVIILKNVRNDNYLLRITKIFLEMYKNGLKLQLISNFQSVSKILTNYQIF